MLGPPALLTLRAWRRASEEVCDAAAQECTDQPLALPRALVKLAHRRATLSIIAMGAMNATHLTHCVEALLSKRETHMKRRRLLALTLLPLALGLLLPVLSSAQPNTPLSTLKVVLDAGHGDDDPGAQGPASEAHVVLAIARHAQRILEQRGIEVVMTREGDDRLAEHHFDDAALRRALIDIIS